MHIYRYKVQIDNDSAIITINSSTIIAKEHRNKHIIISLEHLPACIYFDKFAESLS